MSAFVGCDCKPFTERSTPFTYTVIKHYCHSNVKLASVEFSYS